MGFLKAREIKYYNISTNTKGNSETGKSMVSDQLNIKTATTIKGILKMIFMKVRENLFFPMVKFWLAIGSRTSSMDMRSIFTRTGGNTKEIGEKDSNTAEEPIFGRMAGNMKGNGKTTISTEKESSLIEMAKL